MNSLVYQKIRDFVKQTPDGSYNGFVIYRSSGHLREDSGKMKKKLAKTLQQTCDNFHSYGNQVLDFKDPENLHQMRVNGRTLLTYFSLLTDKKERAGENFIGLQKSLKKVMASLGKLRDADVLIEKFEKNGHSFPMEQKKIVNTWLTHVRLERERLRERLSIELPLKISKDWSQQMKKWIDAKISQPANQSLIKAKIKRLSKDAKKKIAAIRMFSSLEMTDKDLLNAIHQGRISVKKLRYALHFQNSPARRKDIDALKALQEQLGGIQDKRTWIGKLQELFEKNDTADTIIRQWHNEMLLTLLSTTIFNYTKKPKYF